jgi:Mn2+/Fe2+ NRAMP family transporter
MPAPSTSPPRQEIVAAAFILGAAAGGVLSGAVGGILGACVAVGALAVSLSNWPRGLRATLTVLILVGGFGTLWIGAGAVRATLGLIEAGRLAPR